MDTFNQGTMHDDNMSRLVSVCKTDTGCQTDMPHSIRAEAAKVAPMPIALLRSRLPRMAASIKVHMAVMVVNREPTKKR